MKLLLICLFVSHSLFAFTLSEKFQQAQEGTYVVTKQNQITSLLHLHTVHGNHLLFEEISIPSHQVDHQDWKEWVKEGAKGHTSWILYEVDLDKHSITECYSFSRKAWIPTDEMDAFLIPLLSLELNHLSEEKRLQRGPTQAAGQVGSRPWGPPQVIASKKIENPQYDVYTARWPHDDTDLSGKSIVLYFDKLDETFPFPYWMQAREGALKFRIRAIDSGNRMTSPIDTIPRRQPLFQGGVSHEEGSITLSLNLPTYYNTLHLYAVDLTETPRITHTVPFTAMRYHRKGKRC